MKMTFLDEKFSYLASASGIVIGDHQHLYLKRKRGKKIKERKENRAVEPLQAPISVSYVLGDPDSLSSLLTKERPFFFFFLFKPG